MICNKLIDVQQLEKLEEDIMVTMCLLEKYFPPSFFTIMMHLTVHIVREVKLYGPVYLRWMYPFERYMKVLKNYVRNRHRPEGCIAESYIVEEAIEFCSDFLSEVDPVGLGIDRLDASLDNSSFGRPLSAGVSFKPKQDLLYQAHRYVLANTIDVQPYIDKHVEVLQLKYPNKVLHQKWIQEEHNRTFISWLREEVASEIGMGNVEISDNLRWIAYGPHPSVIKYNSYVINGCRYHTESYDKNRSVQNSGVSLVAKTMQVSSSKDKNSIIGDMSFYGVIQDIWELNYNTFNVAVFRCDWVENNNSMKIYDLGFVLVDLKRIGHKSDSFIMATQARQVFYVEDPSDARWSIVLTPPQRDCEDQSNDDELGDIMLHCQGVPSDMPNVDRGNDLDENMSTYDNLFTHGANDSKRHQDKEVGGAEIDGLVVGVVDEHVEKPKQQRKRRPTIMFDATRVRSECERKLVEYNGDGVPIGENGAKLNSFIGSCVHYHISIIYATWIDVPAELKEKIYTIVEARVDKKGQYDNEDVQEVVNPVSKQCFDTSFGYTRSSGRVRGVGGFVTPSTYFHTAKRSKKRNEEIDKLSEENEKLRLRVQELENIHISTQSTPTFAHGSCSRPRLEYDIQCKRNVEKEVVKKEVNVDVIILNDLHKDAIEVRNEKEVVCESNMKMPLPLKTILRFAEKVMLQRYLHSQDELSNYIFVDPSLIFVGHNTQEVRARNLYSRLMASKPNQLVLAPFNPGAITIFRSQKNIQTSRKQPIWKTMKEYYVVVSWKYVLYWVCPLQVRVVECGYYVMRYMRDIITNGSIVVTDLIDTRTSYSQLELDEVRTELADFLGGHM
ncbi:hypothetical protein IC582_008421 [Cucumis melo]